MSTRALLPLATLCVFCSLAVTTSYAQAVATGANDANTDNLSGSAAAQQALVQLSERIVGTVLMHNDGMDFLEELADEHGKRVTGSDGYRLASEWVAQRFRAAGISDVRLETFTIPNGWERISASGQLLVPLQQILRVASAPWSPSTAVGGIQGDVVWLDQYSLANIQARRENIKDHIVMVDYKTFYQERRNYTDFVKSFVQLKDVGALAVLLVEGSENNIIRSDPLSNGARIVELPVGQVGMEDGLLMERLLGKGQVVKISIDLQNKVSGPTIVNNVIAEIPGREKPDEWVIAGGHLDAWDFGTGAEDDGSGDAMVYAAAKAIQALAVRPRRSLRFVLWGGEEQGIMGSRAYVQAHAAELNRCVAALVTDNGAGHARGWGLAGREDMVQAMKPISGPLLKGLGGDELLPELRLGSDHTSLLLEGVPTMELLVDDTHYEELHHQSSDTFDKVNAHNLLDDAAVLAVTAFAIADMPEPLAPHLDHASVEAILKKAGVDEYLRENGFWK
jgi:carboxypeptidase Q